MRNSNRKSSLNNSIDKQNITQNLDKNITNEQEIHQKELEDNKMIQLDRKSTRLNSSHI